VFVPVRTKTKKHLHYKALIPIVWICEIRNNNISDKKKTKLFSFVCKRKEIRQNLFRTCFVSCWKNIITFHLMRNCFVGTPNPHCPKRYEMTSSRNNLKCKRISSPSVRSFMKLWKRYWRNLLIFHVIAWNCSCLLGQYYGWLHLADIAMII
jgi:hypothetical protein